MIHERMRAIAPVRADRGRGKDGDWAMPRTEGTMHWESRKRLDAAEARMARAASAGDRRGYEAAWRAYALEYCLSQSWFGFAFLLLADTLPGCWIALTAILWGAWKALLLGLAGHFTGGAAAGLATGLFAAAWWTVNRHVALGSRGDGP